MPHILRKSIIPYILFTMHNDKIGASIATLIYIRLIYASHKLIHEEIFGMEMMDENIKPLVQVEQECLRLYDDLVRRLLEVWKCYDAPSLYQEVKVHRSSGRPNQISNSCEDEATEFRSLLSENRRLIEENRSLRRRLDECQETILEAIAAPETTMMSQHEHKIDLLETELYHMRELLRLQNQTCPDSPPGEMRFHNWTVSPSQSSASFFLSTPPRSPPTNGRSNMSWRPTEKGTRAVAPVILTEHDLGDIADVGPPMSPPSKMDPVRSGMTRIDDHIADLEDSKDRYQGASDVDHDLGN